MSTGFLFDPRIKTILLWALSAALAIAAGFGMFSIAGLVIIIGLTILALVISVTRLDLGKLVVTFLAAYVLVHLLKRVVCLTIPSKLLYQATLFIPTLIMGVLLVATSHRLTATRLPGSAVILGAYIIVAVGTTLLSMTPMRIPWFERFAAIHQDILPFFMYYVGIALRFDHLNSITKLMIGMTFLSVAYGLVQFFGGPTPLDIVWAYRAWPYSLQARKVAMHLLGYIPEFRVYSFFPDPESLGLFLNTTLALSFIARSSGRMNKATLCAVTVTALAGLFCTLSRGVWAILAGMIGMALFLKQRRFRHAWMILILIIGLFPVVIGASKLLLEKTADEMPDLENVTLRRYATIGTLSDRTYDYSDIRRVARAGLFMGSGYAYSDEFAVDFSPELVGAMGHNFVMALIMYVGVPGTILFFCFLFAWFTEGFRALRAISDDTMRRAILWLLAWFFGTIVTGYFSSTNLMQPEFFLVAGMLAGYRVAIKSVVETPSHPATFPTQIRREPSCS